MTTTTGYLKDRICAYIENDPEAKLDYSIDWKDWIVGSDYIVNAHWTISTITNDPSPMTQWASNVMTVATSLCTAYIQAGSTGNTYTITNRITTSNGIREERFFRIVVKDRTL
jgi:hypothetical protein